MKKTVFSFAILISIFSGVSGLQKAFATAPADSTKKRSMSITLDGSTSHRDLNNYAYSAYVNALLLEQIGDYWGAAENYKLALNYYPDSYELGYSLAELYYRMRDPQKSLDQLATIKPVDASYYRLQAACYQSLGDAEHAQDAYLNLVKLEPDNEQAFAFLATAYRAKQNVDSTIWAYESLSKLQQDNFRIFNELGKLYAQRGALDKAKSAFQKSLAANTTIENVAAFGGLGELYTMSKQLDSAEAAYKSGLVVDPDNIMLHRQLVTLYVDRDSFDLALPHARKVVEIAPLDRPSVRRLALLYFRLDSLNQADSIFSDLIRGGEHIPANHYYLGHIALRKHELERARTEFQMVADVEDTVAQSWLDLGFVFSQLKQPEREIELYQEGLKRVHDEDGVHRLTFALASALERSGKWDEAVVAFEQILAKDPKNHQALNYLGYMFVDKNVRLEEAKSLLERALALAPDNGAYLDSYGWLFYRENKFDKAIEYLEKAAAGTADAVVYEHLGDAYKGAGKDDMARQWWQKAAELAPDSIALKEKLEK